MRWDGILITLGIVIGVVVLGSMINATPVEDNINLNIQTTFDNGSIEAGTFNFTFYIVNETDCAGDYVVFTHMETITTDSRGITNVTLVNVSLNMSMQYWICYYRNGTLKSLTKIARSPYSFFGTNTTWAGIQDVPEHITGNYTNQSFWVNWTEVQNKPMEATENYTDVAFGLGVDYNYTNASFNLCNQTTCHTLGEIITAGGQGGAGGSDNNTAHFNASRISTQHLSINGMEFNVSNTISNGDMLCFNSTTNEIGECENSYANSFSCWDDGDFNSGSGDFEFNEVDITIGNYGQVIDISTTTDGGTIGTDDCSSL